MSNITQEGAQLVDAWLNAQQAVERTEQQLRSDKHHLESRHDALAKWLAPSDMKVGEKIGVWHGDGLIQVEKHEQHAGTEVESGKAVTRVALTVTVRSRGKHGLHSRS
jgi:hypothetical protein